MNPELRRYAWLELGLHELVITPLVLAALAAMTLATDHPSVVLAWGSLTVFLMLTAGWGCMRAWNSVSDEVRDRTWDFQRMAAIRSSSVALGKVFGAPLLQWYVGAWCLVVFALAAPRAQLPNVGSTLVALVATAVLLHALGVAGSAIGARAMLADRARRTSGIVVLVLMLNVLPMPVALLFGTDPTQGRVQWWGMGWSSYAFLAASTVVFAAWALLGAARAMAREFREPVRYGVWPAFALFLALWVAGLHPAHGKAAIAEIFAIIAFVLAFATYVGLTLDPLTRVAYARWRRAWQSQSRSRSRGMRLPGWILDAALAVAAGIVAIVAGLGERMPDQVVLWHWSFGPMLSLSVALMALRDAAVVSCFTLSATLRRPLGRAAFYIALADLLAPLLFATAGQPMLARIVFPLWGFNGESLLPVWGMALHAAVALAVLGVRMGTVRDNADRKA